MIELGTHVKLNIPLLVEKGWEGLTVHENDFQRDYVTYIQNNEDKTYVIDSIMASGQYKLQDPFLSTTSFLMSELIIVEKIVVYTSEHGDEYSREEIENEIDIWMDETDKFQHLNLEQRNHVKKATYDVLISLLDWTSPYTKLTEFEEDDVEELLERAKVNEHQAKKIELDFPDLIEIVMAVSSAKKVGWNFYTDESEDGLIIVAKHDTGKKFEIKNHDDLESFCISGRLKR